MLPQRSIATLLVLAVLVPAATPLAAAHLSDLLPDASPVQEVPRELPDGADPACAPVPDTCQGIEDAMGDVRRLGLPDGEEHHEPEAEAEEMQHAARDHLVYGACADAQPACETVERLAAGESPAVTLTITNPRADAGARTGTNVSIAWRAEAADLAQSGALFRVQVKPLAAGGAWTDVEGYRCAMAESDSFPAGSCRATWVPAATGAHAVRVVYVEDGGDLPLCQVGYNCDLVAPFHVDDAAPSASPACVIVGAACADPAGRLDATTLTVNASAADDQGVTRLSVVATGPSGVASCALYEGAPTTPLPAAGRACALDVASILDSPAPGLYAGFVDLRVEALDAAGNLGRSAPVRYEVATEADDVAVAELLTPPARYYESGGSAALTFKAVYASPPSKAGLPVVGEAFTVRSGGATLCGGTTSGSGTLDCTLTGAEAEVAYVASVTPRAGLDAAPRAFTLTWTRLVLTRAADADLPAPTLATNAGDVYSAAFDVTTSHDGRPVAGALVSLKPAAGQASHEVSDENGRVLVPVHSATSAVLSFNASGAYSPLRGATAAPVTLTWSRIVVTSLAVDDDFVGVGDNVTLTGQAAYEHDPARPVALAFLGLGQSPGCVLGQGTIVNGSLRAVVRCTTPQAASLSLKVAASDLAVTRLAAPLSLQATWTRVNLTGLSSDKALVNVNDTVTVTGAATWVHDGSPVASGSVGLDAAPAGCAASNGAISAGVLSVKVRCAGVLNASAKGVPLAVTGTDKGVTALAQPAAAKGVWTSVTFSNVSVDDPMVNVNDTVTVTAQARYAHDPTVPLANATLQFAGTPVGCTFLSGNVTAGAAQARIVCSTVKNLTQNGIPLGIASSDTGVTAVNGSFRPRAVWTQVEVGPVQLSDDFVNANDWIRVEAGVTYAHDGSPVPSGTVALAAGGPADCAMLSGGVLNGRASAYLRCTGVHDLRAAPLRVLVTGTYHNVTRVNGSLPAPAVWTRVQVSDVRVDDAMTNVTSVVTLTARATYAHDNSSVAVGSVAIGNATDPCFLWSGTISNGTLRAEARCDAARNASAAGIPLVVSGTDKGVANMTGPLALRAIWTAINVSYALDVAPGTLGAGSAVLVTVNLTYAHDGTPVRRGIATVRASDGDEQQCQANATGQCTIEVFRDLGTVTFNVTGASTYDDAVLVPDVTGQARFVPGFTKRWTAIGFAAFECRPAADPEAPAQPCDGAAFPKGTQVVVRTRAVAADNASQPLPFASVRVDGEQLTTDQQGWVEKVVVRTTAGVKSVTARGLGATIDGQAITATVVRTESIGFE